MNLFATLYLYEVGLPGYRRCFGSKTVDLSLEPRDGMLEALAHLRHEVPSDGLRGLTLHLDIMTRQYDADAFRHAMTIEIPDNPKHFADMVAAWEAIYDAPRG